MLNDKKQPCTWLQLFIKDNVILTVLAIFFFSYFSFILLLPLYLTMQHIISKILLTSSISSKGEYRKRKTVALGEKNLWS